MIDLKALRANPEPFKRSAKLRNATVDIDRLLELDAQRSSLLTDVEALRAVLNVKGKPSPQELKQLQDTKSKLEPLEIKLRELEAEHRAIWLQIPNLVADDMPEGRDDTENVVLRQVGNKPQFDFDPKEHWELGAASGLIETEKAGQVAGSRFAYLMGGLARLQFALMQFVINVLTDEETIKTIVKRSGLKVSATPFTLVIPPAMIRSEVLEKMARLEPREDRYQLPDDDLYLAGSAEHTLGPLHMNETVDEQRLPIRYLGYSTAFRREAGSYGKDVKGILRMHQFDKLEMETFSTPESSVAEQELLVAIQEYLMQALQLPYQVVAVCTGDTGAPDYRQIDIETWMPGQNKYRETHSADLMTDYQSRRLGTRLRRADGSIALVHMNDATAVAVGRLLIAIMENYQQKDGSIAVPTVLQSYFGGSKL